MEFEKNRLAFQLVIVLTTADTIKSVSR